MEMECVKSPKTASLGRRSIWLLKAPAAGLKVAVMGKTKAAATGKGYLGEIMVHRITGAIGVVESVVEAKAGWPPELTIKLKDGTTRKAKLSEFRDANPHEKKESGLTTPPETPPAA